MAISRMFDEMGAPLRNVQWSWGAQRADGVVFLRVWQDETVRRDEKTYIRLANHGAYQNDQANLGYLERLRHLEAIARGAKAYAVIVRAVDPAASPRSIAGFNRKDVFRLGSVIDISGDEWAEIADRVPISKLATVHG